MEHRSFLGADWRQELRLPQKLEGQKRKRIQRTCKEISLKGKKWKLEAGKAARC